jgi:hypothetical protein
MKSFTQPDWALNIPDDWESEVESECAVLYHPDKSGTLQISSTRHEDNVTETDLMEIASEHIEAGAILEDATLGDFDGFTLSYATDDEYWREWYLRCDTLMLFVTYYCNLEEEGADDDIIDAILETLRVVE